ncbi:MAG: HlyD family efflux transporter periplasmic adaptor subunit [Candidatus Kapabacteria bacterium]|nr:HlyD family efflux transporter periplasmic adaptor subunit [Candidatus Kapabacteria bacterium]
MIVVLILSTAAFLAFVPWQQTVVGSGIVTSFAPEARPQTVESRINGNIVRWYVREGAYVNKGDTLAILADNNVNFLDTNLLHRLQVLRDRTFDAQEKGISVAIQRRKQAEQRFNAALARLENVIVEITTARVRYQRAETLFKQDLISRVELETAQLNLQKASADSASSVAAMNASQQDINAFVSEEERVINQAFVSMQEVDVRLGNAQGRVGAGVILSPVSGTVVRIAKAGAGQSVKEGEELALVVPKTTDQAVEIYLKSMDAALIQPGRYVSLQFSGFPAFQFSGWRNINVGIFHGRVKVIDAVDDGTGRFRVLIVPTEDQGYMTWPDARYLRQGTDVSGWVLLDEVPLGYELWRQMMGFPPQFPVEGGIEKKAKKDKKDLKDKMK